jgi:AmmeMemoRadiSam system protein B/AmmeMemoRadiSam system protein A
MNFQPKLFFRAISIMLLGLVISGCQPEQNYLKLEEISKNKEATVVREAAVAGAFYPKEKSTLIKQIDEFLAKAEPVETKGSLKILIVPHAGYDYSGPVAAWGFKQLEKNSYKRVIILGISHSSYFENAALWKEGSWRTPLGLVKVDEDFANQLISGSEKIQANPDVHLREHSLEVELPFLQRVLGEFKIVPILLGQTSEAVLQDLAKNLAKNLDDNTLLVVSSDLSHYPTYEVANKVDKETVEAILSGEVERFEAVIQKNLDQPGTETCACGAVAIKVAMLLGKELKFDEIKLLKYANSGDTAGDKSRVVGYVAIGFYGSNKKISNSEGTEKLSKKQQSKLLEIARKTLENYLKDKKILQFDITDKQLNQKLGVFVTLRKDNNLRGCIGEFESDQPLYKLIQKKVIDSATADPRFYPVQYNELDSIKIEISVLLPMKKINDWQKIELGKHGVFIKNGQKGGTFLPQVAQESGWGKEEFLSHLCVDKAGLASDCYKDLKTEIYIYTAQVFGEE